MQAWCYMVWLCLIGLLCIAVSHSVMRVMIISHTNNSASDRVDNVTRPVHTHSEPPTLRPNQRTLNKRLSSSTPTVTSSFIITLFYHSTEDRRLSWLDWDQCTMSCWPSYWGRHVWLVVLQTALWQERYDPLMWICVSRWRHRCRPGALDAEDWHLLYGCRHSQVHCEPRRLRILWSGRTGEICHGMDWAGWYV